MADRLTGMGIDVLARKYNVPRSTLYYWIRGVEMSDGVRKQLIRNSDNGRRLGRIAMAKRRQREELSLKIKVGQDLENLPITKELAKLCCSLLFWGEGAKNLTQFRLINSDPSLIKTFLILFRKAFVIDEEKFRITMQFHEYHDIKAEQTFWSDLSGIPLQQFSKPYMKPHTGITKKQGYRGCMQLKYSDSKIAKELYWLYTTLHQKLTVG